MTVLSYQIEHLHKVVCIKIRKIWTSKLQESRNISDVHKSSCTVFILITRFLTPTWCRKQGHALNIMISTVGEDLITFISQSYCCYLELCSNIEKLNMRTSNTRIPNVNSELYMMRRTWIFWSSRISAHLHFDLAPFVPSPFDIGFIIMKFWCAMIIHSFLWNSIETRQLKWHMICGVANLVVSLNIIILTRLEGGKTLVSKVQVMFPK